MKKNEVVIDAKYCPVCNTPTRLAYAMHEAQTGENGIWYTCKCGIIFQGDKPSDDLYDSKYIDEYKGRKRAEQHAQHLPYIYAPIIEEITYGRMVLEVGFCYPYVMRFLEDRGWLTWGIEVNKDIGGHDNIFQGDFTNYDFSIPITDEVKEHVGDGSVPRTFDLIWMGNSLGHMSYPLKALKKAYDLLTKGGVLFLTIPDIDLLHQLTPQGFRHWNKKEYYTMWSKRALRREVEKLGFELILNRTNLNERFLNFYDIHLIAQKPYI